jgi:hypothetical protein
MFEGDLESETTASASSELSPRKISDESISAREIVRRRVKPLLKPVQSSECNTTQSPLLQNRIRLEAPKTAINVTGEDALIVYLERLVAKMDETEELTTLGGWKKAVGRFVNHYRWDSKL